MHYKELIETISAIVENELISKNGLSLTYTLDEKNHSLINEQLFYKSNPAATKFKPSDEFEVELGGIVVKFIKEKPVQEEEDL
jgi:hypothetical protein